MEKFKNDLVKSLKAVNTIAQAMHDRIEELSADVNGLKTKLAKSPSTEIVELPNPLRKRA
jgi:hypothetical protein